MSSYIYGGYKFRFEPHLDDNDQTYFTEAVLSQQMINLNEDTSSSDHYRHANTLALQEIERSDSTEEDKISAVADWAAEITQRTVLITKIN